VWVCSRHMDAHSAAIACFSCMIRHGWTHDSSNGCCKPDVLETSPQFSFGIICIRADSRIPVHCPDFIGPLKRKLLPGSAAPLMRSTLGWYAIYHFCAHSISRSFGALLSSDRVQSLVSGVDEPRYFCYESMCSTANKSQPSPHQNGL